MAALGPISSRLGNGGPANSDLQPYSLEKFTLYETQARFILVGRDRSETHFRVLKIDRLETSELNISEDPVVYTQSEFKNLLQTFAEGNLATGGITKVTKAYGIVGFTRFMESYHMILITKHRQVGTLCGHAIYAIEDTQLVTIPHPSVQTEVASSKTEIRYKKLLSGVDLTKDFFFSYTYRIMQSLQRNVLAPKGEPLPYENMFVWNAYLTRSMREQLNSTRWTVALVHGFFQQTKLSIFGRIFVITLIARRSRHFAGTRYLKRGVNDHGKVANDVETEQVVFDEEAGHGAPVGQMSSVVQNRGSVPLFWSQEASKLSAKPDIILQRYDPMYQATKLHFDDLSHRYGDPIIILNLIKTVEKRPREMILRREFASAVGYLNNILPEDNRLKFIHWDFHKFAKSKSANVNVLKVLGGVASEALDLTGIYYSGKPLRAQQVRSRMQRSATTVDSIIGRISPPPVRELARDYASLNMPAYSNIKRELDRTRERHEVTGRKTQYQRGVLRTNCIDCLDRTNVAQYAYGLAALGRQLNALGYTDSPKVHPNSLVATALMDTYQNMGDALALQYGGSEAHNTVFPERQGKWKATTQSKEFLKSIKRYYSNTYTDGEKQYAINLFLGHFQPQEGKPALWELDSDYNLHFGVLSNEYPKEVAIAKHAPFIDNMLQHSSGGGIGALPVHRQDYRLTKLTSFDKLLQMMPIKNVRLFLDNDTRETRSSGPSRTAPDAVEVQLKSPNWLFGQRKPEEPSPEMVESAQKAKISVTDDSAGAVHEFRNFDWFALLGPTDDRLERQYRASEEDVYDWYGTIVLPGAVPDSRANQHYEECIGGSLNGLVDIEVAAEADRLFADDRSDGHSYSNKSDDVEAAMENALEEFEEIGSDVGSILPGGGPSLEFTSGFAQWLLKADTTEDSESEDALAD